MSSVIDQTLKQFSLYLADPDNIQEKSLRVFFEKQIIKINKAIGTKFFGLFSRKVEFDEIVTYFSCCVLLSKMSTILEKEGFIITGNTLGYSSDTKGLFKAYLKDNTIVVITSTKEGNKYSLDVYFRKNFDTTGYGNWSLRELNNKFNAFINKQNLMNPHIYDPMVTKVSDVFIKEFERRMKVYTWVNINHLLKESGFSRFMRKFED